MHLGTDKEDFRKEPRKKLIKMMGFISSKSFFVVVTVFLFLFPGYQ